MPSLESWWPAVLLGVIAVSATAPGAGTHPTPYGPWVVLAASGSVEAQSLDTAADLWRRVRPGERLEPRTAIRTGPRGQATLARGSTVVILDPGSLLELPHEAFASARTELDQRRGGVTYDVDGRGTRGFRVHTPFLVAGVKGTLFRVTVTEAFAAVTVEKGVVEVASRGREEPVEVRTGQSVRVRADEGADVKTDDLRAREQRREAQGEEAGRFASAALRSLREASVRSGGEGGRDDPAADPRGLLEDAWDDELGKAVDELDEQKDELTEDLLHTEVRRLETTDASDPR